MSPNPATPNGFTQIWNALIVDQRLTPTAKLVAIYLGSKTTDWITREHEVTTSLHVGKAAYRAALQNLNEAGYLTRGDRHQDRKTGRWSQDPVKIARGLIVADPAKAQVAPKTDFRQAGSPGVGSPDIGEPDNLHNTEYPTLTTQQEDPSTEGLRGNSEEPRSVGLRVSTCKVCSDVNVRDLPKGATLADFHAFHVEADKASA